MQPSITGAALSPARAHLKTALAAFDHAEAHRRTTPHRMRRSFKPLVLAAVPAARVQRLAPGLYGCFIGERRVRLPGVCCGAGHSAPDLAWLCLAQYIASEAFEGAQ